MTTTHEAAPTSGAIRSLIPARIDRLPWSPFHTRMVVALGVAWILDGLEITVAGAVVALLTKGETLGLSSTQAGLIATVYLVIILLALVYFADPAQHRWIRLGPFGRLQPSEFAKPAISIFLAYFIALRSQAINSRYTLLPAIIAIGFITFAVVVADPATLTAQRSVIEISQHLQPRSLDRVNEPTVRCALGTNNLHVVDGVNVGQLGHQSHG